MLVIADIIPIFNTAFIKAITRFDVLAASSTTEKISDFLNRTNPFYMMTPEGLPVITNMVFNDEEVRDFIFMVTSIFFSTADIRNEDLRELTSYIAHAITPFECASEFCLAPEDIKERFTTSDEIIQVFRANNWILVLVMMVLYITSTDMEKSLTTLLEKN